MPTPRWRQYIPRQLPVTFALQYFLNKAALTHIQRYAHCAHVFDLDWHLIVHEDDGEPSHAARWQRSLRNYGRNATLVLSQNVHELRAYNMAARMRKADIVVFLQDDEEPPASEGCEWLGRGLAAFGLNKQLGAVGLRRGATNGDWDDEVRRHGRPSLGQSALCSTELEGQARYVLAVDLAPLLVRRKAFVEVGGFPTFLTPPGVPGVGMDTLLSIRLWRRGWQVLLMPHHFVSSNPAAQRSVEDAQRSNSQSSERVAQYVKTARFIKETFLYNRTDPWRNRTLRKVHRLNAEQFENCSWSEWMKGERERFG